MSRTVIHGRVFRLQIVHLQVQHAVGIIPGDGEAPLHSLRVVNINCGFTYKCNPFQAFSRTLPHPVHYIAMERESRTSTGEAEGLSRPLYIPSSLHQLDLWLHTWKERYLFKEMVHTNSTNVLVFYLWRQKILPLKTVIKKTNWNQIIFLTGIFWNFDFQNLWLLDVATSESCNRQSGLEFCVSLEEEEIVCSVCRAILKRKMAWDLHTLHIKISVLHYQAMKA